MSNDVMDPATTTEVVTLGHDRAMRLLELATAATAVLAAILLAFVR